MSSIFISYSRRDAPEFVLGLRAALAARGYEAWVDARDIVPSMDWREEIRLGIEGADAFVFVVTPGALRSDGECLRELAIAVQYGKRLVRLLRLPISEPEPASLDRVHWVSMHAEDDQQAGLDQLVRALEHDLDWTRQHTHLLQRAMRWATTGSHSSYLLGDQELTAALAWQAEAGARPERVPGEPIERYVAASETARVEARVRAAEEHARVSGARLAVQAELVRQESPLLLERSVLLAAEAMRRAPSFEADQALRKALMLMPRVLQQHRQARPVEVVRFSLDGTRWASGGRDGVVRISAVGDAADETTIAVGAEVRDLVLSDDGQTVVTASGDGMARIWTLPAGTLRTALPSGTSLSRVRFSPDETLIATASWDGTVAIWETATGREVVRVRHDKAVLHLAFAPSGDLLATASQDGTARGWALDGREVVRIAAETSDAKKSRTMSRVAFAPDGARVAVGTGAGSVLLCDARTGAVQLRIPHAGHVRAIAYSPDGRWLATGEDGGAAIWDALTGRLHRRLCDGFIWDVAFDARGEVLATAGGDGLARVWICANGVERVRALHAHAVYSIALSPDGRLLATASADHAYDQWLDAGGPTKPFHGDANGAWRWETRGGAVAGVIECASQVLDLARTGADRFVVATAGGTVQLWSGPRAAAPVSASFAARVRSAVCSPDGARVAIGGERGVGCILDAATGAILVRLDGSADRIIDRLVWTADGRHLAGALVRGTPQVWSADTGALASDVDGVLDVVGDHGAIIALSPDRTLLATATRDRSVVLLDRARGTELARLAHDDQVTALLFSPDGTLLATGSEDHCARLWEVATGVELARFAHENDVGHIAFSPEGQHLASGGFDRTARIWSLASRLEVARLPHLSAVSAVTFTADGQHVVTVSDRLVQFWLWQPADLLADAATRVTRGLTEEEVRRYLPEERAP